MNDRTITSFKILKHKDGRYKNGLKLTGERGTAATTKNS